MRYETTTSLAPAAALLAAEEYFIGELGLTERVRSPKTVEFECGGGHVAINILGERPTTLEIETRDWGAPTTEFIHRLPR